MPIVLGLIAALSYGSGDFLAGLAGKRVPPPLVTGVVQVLGLVAAGIAVLIFPGVGPERAAILWGAAAGVGSAGGTLSLYHGLSAGRMSVVATLSGLLTAVIPVLVGLALGEGLSPVSAAGIVIAVPAIGLVSWSPGSGGPDAASGAIWGVVAGVGFALLFVALDQAGTRSGAWPLVSGQAVALLLVAPLALRSLRGTSMTRPTSLLMLSAGLFSGLANLAFLAATREGALAVVAILTALYPGVTVMLARIVLGERWSHLQGVGLAAAFSAAVLVSAGAS
jgi:drug/metabolite transporter (DMT)-like permease